MFKEILKKFSRSYSHQDINYEALKKMMRKFKNIYLIDIRTKQEYEEGHLLGAINICLYDIEKDIKKLDKDSKIILYCSSGIRSKKAKEKLKKLGYTDVYNLEGGLQKISN